MIVWGGSNGDYESLDTGARYDPVTNSWTPTSVTNAPSARLFSTAVWTGSEMIVWGGQDQDFMLPDTGGRYDPDRDSWIATGTTNAPDGRYAHTAVWTGSEMIVWGGYNGGASNSGSRYCAQPDVPIALSASRRKVQGINTVRLTWSGVTSTSVDVYRDRSLIATVKNTGSYVDSTGDTGQALYTYRICEVGTQTCSNNAKVKFPR